MHANTKNRVWRKEDNSIQGKVTDKSQQHNLILDIYSGGFRVVPRVPWNPSFMQNTSLF